MRFCNQCGKDVAWRIPDGEDRERHVCATCGAIHYQNPKMVVGCLIEHGGRILMCRRAIEPRRGFWTIPAGFLELGESAIAGAVRETHEEANASVRVIAPYAHFDVPDIGQAYIVYRAQLLEERFGPGPESLEVTLMKPDELPWDELAFPVVRFCLELLCEDLDSGRFRCHQGELVRKAEGYLIENRLSLSIG